MARAAGSLIAVAWLLAANQVAAGPIATAGDAGAASSELASIGGLLQALGAGVIGNGALLYPTAASSHQREESEILASDTATRVFKKVKSILKEGGINEDENGEDESKSVTYLIKPAMIFHKEEVPPPNPLAGNVLPLPGGALMYTPGPTAAAGVGEPTSGPAASLKAAYGNLFAASPYYPSYTLNKPHAAVIVEEITDMISLKSAQQRLEDTGEETDDDDDDEDEYGRKRKGKRPMKIISLETVDSSSTFINPFTRADFPFGILTPAMPAPTAAPKAARKTVKKPLPSNQSSTASDQIRASMGKDGSITVVNNMPATTSPPGTTIVIPASSPQGSSSSATPSSSASASESGSSSHEESKNPDLHANEVTRVAHGHTAKGSEMPMTRAKGLRREAASSFDPLASDPTPADALSTLEMLASESIANSLAAPTATVGKVAATDDVAQTTVTKRRKMRIVRVYEVKKNKSTTVTVATHSTVVPQTATDALRKRDVIPVYDGPAPVAAVEVDAAAQPTPLYPVEDPVPAAHVIHNQRVENEDDSDAEGDMEMDDVSDATDASDASDASDALSDMALGEQATTAAPESTSATAAPESASATEIKLHNTSSKALSIETVGVASTDLDSLQAEANASAVAAAMAAAMSPTQHAESSASASAAKATPVDSDSDKEDGSDSDSEEESASGKGAELDSDDESDDDDSEKDRPAPKAKARMMLATRGKEDGMAGIQRMAAFGMEAAERAVMDYEQHSTAAGVEILTTEDARPVQDAETSAILSPSDTEPASTAANLERAAKPAHSAHKATDAEDDDDDDSDKDNDNDDDDDDDKEVTKKSKTESSKSSRRGKKEEESDNDDDNDGNSGPDSDEDDDNDSDDDEDSGKKSKKAKSSQKSHPERASRTTASADEDGSAMDIASEDASEGDMDLESEEASEAERDEADEEHKALAEAASESAQQVVELETTHVESGASASDEHHGSGLARGFLQDLFSELEDASDESASGHAASGTADGVLEFETEAARNSDGEEIEFITQIVSDVVAKNAKETHSPSVVAKDSDSDSDDDYEEEYVTRNRMSSASAAKTTATHAAVSSTSRAAAAAASTTSAARFQRNVEDSPDATLVRGAETTPDVDLLKESQNRAINIGMGNLRRHV